MDFLPFICKETDICSMVEDLAKKCCIGNERKSWLESATLDFPPHSTVPGNTVIVFNIRLRNQAGIFYRGIRCGTAFSDTCTVRFTGIIGSSCLIQKYTVSSQHMLYGLLGEFATLLANHPLLNKLLAEKVCGMLNPKPQVSSGLIAFREQELKLSNQDAFKYDLDPLVKQFQDVSNKVIDCTVPITLTAKGVDDIKVITHGILIGATCDFHVYVKKSDVPGWFQEDAIHVPQQRFECVFATNAQPINIDFTIEPVVFIENGRAVNAVVNMDNVAGIPSWAGNYLESFVNSSSELSQSIVKLVNSIGIIDPEKPSA